MKNKKNIFMLFAVMFIANVQKIHSAAIGLSDTEQLESDFIIAVCCGDIDTVRECLAKNVNVNSFDKFGRTALLSATELGETEVVRSILQHTQNKPEGQININVATGDGENALILASKYGQTAIVRMLLDYKQKDRIQRIDVNHTNNDGETALMIAVKRGFKGIVRLLLQPIINDDGSADHSRVDVNKIKERFR